MNDQDADLTAMAEPYRRDLVEPASMLLAIQKLTGQKVRKTTKVAYGSLIDAHLLVLGVLGSTLLRISGRIVLTTATSEERSALFASFVIGLPACEGAIEEGRYLQGLALLRQEMETVAQLIAVRIGTKKNGRSPNIAVLEKSVARLYSDLSAAAHVARHEMVRTVTEYPVAGDDLPGPTSGARYFPAVDEQLARRAFGLHLILIIRLLEELNTELLERYADCAITEHEEEAVRLAIRIMQAEGVIEVDEATPDQA